MLMINISQRNYFQLLQTWRHYCPVPNSPPPLRLLIFEFFVGRLHQKLYWYFSASLLLLRLPYYLELESTTFHNKDKSLLSNKYHISRGKKLQGLRKKTSITIEVKFENFDFNVVYLKIINVRFITETSNFALIK